MMPPKAPLVTAASYAPSPRPFSEMRQQAWPRLKHDNFQQPARAIKVFQQAVRRPLLDAIYFKMAETKDKK
ncbi:MAG: hypothetical protein WDN02_13955 [Methylovirgula sp.]|uniref:hypothetical protein n=1 Tax=Methylovirgula sp. TaxID=1978224 RepID=UPI003076251E